MIKHYAIAAVDTAMMAVTAQGGLMEQSINNKVKSAVCAAINNIIDRNIQPLVQDTVDNIFISYRDCVLTERQQPELGIAAHRLSVESAFHAAIDNTIYEFQQVVDTTTLDNIAMIDNAIRKANNPFDAKRASIVESILCAAGTLHIPPAPLPQTSSKENPQQSTLPSQPTKLETLEKRSNPLGASKVGWTNVGRRNTDQPGDDEPRNPHLGPTAPPPTHQPHTSYSPPTSPAQPPAREYAQHGGAHPGLPKQSLWTPPINNYRTSNTRSSHHPRGAPPNNTYPPYFALGPCASYNEDSTCYGGGP